MYDKNETHSICDNTYTLAYKGKEVTLHPKKTEPPKKGSRSNVTKEALHVHHVYGGNMKKT